MDVRKLFEDGVEHERNALANTQYTHVHSVDIRRYVFTNYYLPAAQAGYPPAIEKVANYYMQNGKKMKGISWLMKYKKITGCSLQDILWRFKI